MRERKRNTMNDLEEIIKKNTCGKTISDDRNRKVKFVWNIKPQRMLEYCIEADRHNWKSDPDIAGSSHYIGMSLGELREIYENYNGLQELSVQELIDNGYYRLEMR
jgi:hypothetical protein